MTAVCTPPASIEFALATVEHIPAISARMRLEDRAAARAARHTPTEALAFGLAHSSIALTAVIDDVPEIMFGAGDLPGLDRVGGVWLLGTDAVDRHFRLFLRESIRWRAQLLARYDVLVNAVHVDNTIAIRWLEWLGASISAPLPIGANGEMLRPFQLRR